MNNITNWHGDTAWVSQKLFLFDNIMYIFKQIYITTTFSVSYAGLESYTKSIILPVYVHFSLLAVHDG
jgi:hypothetical protein